MKPGTSARSSVRRAVGAVGERGQTLQMRRRLSGLVHDLGAAVLRQREGEAGLEAEIDRLVEEIRALKSELTALSQ
ncbi:MAG: hypothetical protein U0Y82_11445 [Thermoleophilia bacterium]